MVTVKRQCAGQAWHQMGNWGNFSPCTINATVEEDGKWWCKRHAPSLVRARGDARSKALSDKWNEKESADRQAARIAQAQQEVIRRARALRALPFTTPERIAALMKAVDDLDALHKEQPAAVRA